MIKKIWERILLWRIDDVMQALRKYHRAENCNLQTLDPKRVPNKVSGFEDLSYLFASAQANRGVIAQDFDEAAYIWSVVTKNKPSKILEIGRWLGGSTILLASAQNQYAKEHDKLISVDLKVKEPNYAKDDLIKSHLQKLGLSHYELNIANSNTFDPKSSIDFAFIDGDHSYEGVKNDFINVMKYAEPNTDIMFHDAVQTRKFATYHKEVGQLMSEIKNDPRLRLVNQVGSIVHFAVK